MGICMGKIAGYGATGALTFALAWPLTAFTADGLTAVGVSDDGTLVVSATDSGIDMSTGREILVEDSGTGDSLLAVGPGVIQSDADHTWINVLSSVIGIDASTAFPRGMIAAGDYVAVSGDMNADGTVTASNVVHLGGHYSPGISTVYLRGQARDLDTVGGVRIDDASVDLSQAYYDPRLLDICDLTAIEVLGVEAPTLAPGHKVMAYSASILAGITGSGARGITGSGARGITGSGARGITGSGLHS